MKPSDVRLWWRDAIIPLLGLFRRAEYEYAAALLVRACVVNGDEWKPQMPRDIGTIMRADIERNEDGQGYLKTLASNPFCRPDFWGLVKEGFAEFLGDPEKGAPVQFTEKGLEQLRKTCREETEPTESTG